MSAPAPHAARLRRLREVLAGRGPSAVLVTHLPNVRWLCGFTGSAGSLLVTPREAVFFTDFRYRVQAAREVRAARRVEVAGGLPAALGRAVKAARLRTLGFEAERMTVATHRDLARELRGVRLAPLRGTVEVLRAVKDQGEVGAIRRAIAVAGRALPTVAGRLRGRSELEVAQRIERAIREEGGDEPSFPTIVASGRRGAQPHASPTRNRIVAGELVVVDFGVRSGGYCSDLTRTFLPGKWERKAKEIYRIVLEAQEAAIAAIAPGVKASAVDAAARSVIDAAGYGDRFGHGTGHGVGLEVHESPNLSGRSGDVLEAGMVVTVEPGIYLEDYGGVRIEDMVLVTARGCEVMSRRVPKPLE